MGALCISRIYRGLLEIGECYWLNRYCLFADKQWTRAMSLRSISPFNQNVVVLRLQSFFWPLEQWDSAYTFLSATIGQLGCALLTKRSGHAKLGPAVWFCNITRETKTWTCVYHLTEWLVILADGLVSLKYAACFNSRAWSIFCLSVLLFEIRKLKLLNTPKFLAVFDFHYNGANVVSFVLTKLGKLASDF